VTQDDEFRQTAVKVEDWNMRDVQVWAHALGNADLEYSLKKHAVDGPLLLSITEDEVRRDLGISNNLAVRKIEQQIEKLRVGKNLPPSATAQMMLKFAHKEHANGTHLNLPPQSSDLSLAPTARRILVYRIWESMYNDPGTEVSLEPSMTAMPMFLDAVEKEVDKPLLALATICRSPSCKLM